DRNVTGVQTCALPISVAAIIVGIIMYFVWPFVQQFIGTVGDLVNATGYLGTLIYGFSLRMLGPLGLHHIFYLPFWQTGLGGTMRSEERRVGNECNMSM